MRRRVRPIRQILTRPSSASSGPTLADWRTGLEGLAHFQRCFPDLAAQVATWPTTPAHLVRVCEVVFALVDQKIGPLIPFGADIEVQAALDPLAYLHGALDEAHADLEGFLHTMQYLVPEGHGIGLANFYDGEEYVAPDLLTLALWHLFADTEWASGVDVAYYLQEVTVDPHLILDLEPLPSQTDMRALQQQILLPAWPYQTALGELLAYPVERTSNPLANIQNGLSTDGQFQEVAWETLPALFDRVREAQQIEHDYGTFAATISKQPGDLRSLAHALHHAAAAQRHTRGATLMEILGYE